MQITLLVITIGQVEAQNYLTLGSETKSNNFPSFLGILFKKERMKPFNVQFTRNPSGEESIWISIVTAPSNINGTFCGLQLTEFTTF